MVSKYSGIPRPSTGINVQMRQRSANQERPSERQGRSFPGGPVAKTLHSQCRSQGSISSQRTRSQMLQLRICMLQLKILHATTKICCNQKNELKKKIKTKKDRETETKRHKFNWQGQGHPHHCMRGNVLSWTAFVLNNLTNFLKLDI